MKARQTSAQVTPEASTGMAVRSPRGRRRDSRPDARARTLMFQAKSEHCNGSAVANLQKNHDRMVGGAEHQASWRRRWRIRPHDARPDTADDEVAAGSSFQALPPGHPRDRCRRSAFRRRSDGREARIGLPHR